jgi:hypothetical protein
MNSAIYVEVLVTDSFYPIVRFMPTCYCTCTHCPSSQVSAYSLLIPFFDLLFNFLS